MNSKFQQIITTPAMTVPAMTTEEIRITLLEASVEYAKKNITLETLILLAAKIQSFMGMRGEDSSQIVNMSSKIIELSQNSTKQKITDVSIDTMLLESVDKAAESNSQGFLVSR